LSELPPELRRLVEDLLDRARLEGRARVEVGADLRQHLIDGLSRGRSVEELVARFGDPSAVAPLLSAAPVPDSPTEPTMRGDGWLTSLLADVRHGVRALARAPALAFTGVTVLALGMGANAVVFSVLNELLLRPLPVEEPADLVDIWADIEGGNSFLGVSWQDVEAYRAGNQVLEELVAFTAINLELGDNGPAVRAQFTSPGYFQMMGLRAAIGSLDFVAGGRFGEDPTAVLSHAFWTSAFGADPSLVGKTIRLRDIPVTVVGVAPEGFRGHFIGFPVDAWLPVFGLAQLMTGFDPEDRGQQPFEMIGRLRPGVSVGAAEDALNTIAAELERAYPETNRGHGLGVTRTTGLDHSLKAGVTAFVVILSAVSLLVLVVACLNVGSILLVRAMSRERELAIRIALGAGRRRLIRLLVAESAVLSFTGAIAGLLMSWRLNALLASTLRRAGPGLGLGLQIDWRVIGLTAALALIAVCVTSMASVFHVVGKSPAGVLRARGGPERGSGGLRSMLVVGQVTVSVVLVIATGLFTRALVEGGRTDYGFDVDRVAVFPLQHTAETLDRREQIERDLWRSLLDIRGIEAVAWGSMPPVGVVRSPLPVEIPGVEPPGDVDQLLVDHRVVGPGYLATVGVPLLSGRDITAEDDRSGASVAVVTEAFRRQYWAGEAAVGRSFVARGELVTVVGVAADARYIVQDETPDPLVYLSRGRRVVEVAHVAVRAIDPLGATQEIEAALGTLMPERSRLRLTRARTVFDDALLPQRMAVLIVGAMGFTALVLAAVGLYGLIQFTVSRDTNELGVRLALGGRPRHVAIVVVRKGFALAAIGTASGVGISLLLMPSLSAFLSGVSPFDPLTYGSVVACFTVVAALASWLPARRALRLDAGAALRGA
jgi:predicted permease